MVKVASTENQKKKKKWERNEVAHINASAKKCAERAQMSAEIYLFKFSQIYRIIYLAHTHTHGHRMNVVYARAFCSHCV